MSRPMTPCGACGDCTTTSRRRFVAGLSGAVVVSGLLDAWLARLGTTTVSELSAAAASGETVKYPVPSKDGVSIDKNQQVILVRFRGKVMAFPLACPHENTALRWKQADAGFQCPKHDSRYSSEGTYEQGSGRATRNMDRFAVSLDGGSVVVHLDTWYQSDTQAGQWASAQLAV